MRYAPGQTIGHYEIVESLGQGAYAEAYKARDTTDGRIVMLKLPNPQMFADPAIYQRFEREAAIAQRLDDAGVQRSLELHPDNGDPYMVLEYIEGEDLRRRMNEFVGPIPIDVVVDWGHQLAHALAYLHSKGVVHRDLKPENLLVTGDGVVKIVDFGTALLEGARRLTWRGLAENAGTPDYMSPEQIQGGRGDARSDVYSWGVIMYELLAGRVPFEGDNWLAVMAGHLQRTPDRIRASRRDVPAALEAVVLHAMRRAPENRYPTAQAIVDDLDRLDTLDPGAYDLSPEKPVGGMTVMQGPAQVWRLVALVSLGFFAVLVLTVVIALVLR